MDGLDELIQKVSSFTGKSEEEVESFLSSAIIAETLQQLAEDVFLREKDQYFPAFQSLITVVKRNEHLWEKYIKKSGEIIVSAIENAPNLFRSAIMVHFLYGIAPDIIGTDHFVDLFTKHFTIDVLEQDIENASQDEEKLNLIAEAKISKQFFLEFRTKLGDHSFLEIFNSYSEILCFQYPVLYSWFLMAFLDEVDTLFKKKNRPQFFYLINILDTIMEKIENKHDSFVLNRLLTVLNENIDLGELASKLASCKDRDEQSKVFLQGKLGSIVSSQLMKEIDDFIENQGYFNSYALEGFMRNMLKNDAYKGLQEVLQQVIMQQAAKKADSGRFHCKRKLESAQNLLEIIESLKEKPGNEKMIELLVDLMGKYTREDFSFWEEPNFLDLFLENHYRTEGISIVLARAPQFKTNPGFCMKLLDSLYKNNAKHEVVRSLYSVDDLASIIKSMLIGNRQEKAMEILMIIVTFLGDSEFINVLLAIGDFDFDQYVIRCIESKHDDTGRMIDLLDEFSRRWVEREKNSLPLKIAEATKVLQNNYNELVEKMKDSYARLKIDALPYLLDVEWVRLKREIEEFRLHKDPKQFKIEHVWNHIELSLSILLFFMVASKAKENALSTEDVAKLREGLDKYDFTRKIILVKHFMKRGNRGFFFDVAAFIKEQEKFLNAKEGLVPDMALVDIRNADAHKVFIAPPLSPTELEALLVNLETYHAKLEFLKKVKMLYKTGNQRWVKTDVYFSLSGSSHLFPLETGKKTNAREDAVYLSIDSGLVELEPFFFMIDCKKCNAPKVFILNKCNEKKPPIYGDDENHPLGEDILERISEILQNFFTRLCG